MVHAKYLGLYWLANGQHSVRYLVITRPSVSCGSSARLLHFDCALLNSLGNCRTKEYTVKQTLKGGLLPCCQDNDKPLRQQMHFRPNLNHQQFQSLRRKTPYRFTTKCCRQLIRHQLFQTFSGKIPYIFTTKYRREVINGISDTHRKILLQSQPSQLLIECDLG